MKTDIAWGRWVCFLLVLISFAPVVRGEHVDAVSGVDVEVQVVQGTAGGGDVGGLEVELGVYHHGQFVERLAVVTDEKGVAVFEGAALGEHRMARAVAKYKDMHFSSSGIEYLPGHEKVAAEVVVYEVSNDGSAVTMEASHIIFEFDRGRIKVTEYASMVNPSDMAILADRQEQDDYSRALYIEPFAGFGGIEFVEYFLPEAMVVSERGFYDTMAMPPGGHQAGFSYYFELGEESIDMKKRITMPVGKMIVFSKLGPGKIAGLGEPKGSMGEFGGIESEYFSISDIARGEVLEFQIVGLNYHKSSKGQVMVLAVIFILMVGLVGFRMVR